MLYMYVSEWQFCLQLLDALEWCSEVGVECVSVYAFSIDNFKRSPAEVSALMHLAEVKLQEMLKVSFARHQNCMSNEGHPFLRIHCIEHNGLQEPYLTPNRDFNES